MDATSPNTCAEAIQGIVGNAHGFVIVFKLSHGKYGSKDFFLEHAHIIGAFKDGRLHIITVAKIAIMLGLLGQPRLLPLLFYRYQDKIRFFLTGLSWLVPQSWCQCLV